MGNHHSNESDLHFSTDHYQKSGFVARRKQKLEELKKRRQSMPLERLVMDSNVNHQKHSNFTSFAYGDREENLQRPVTPRIQINGQDSGTQSGDTSPLNQQYSLNNQVPLSVSQSYSGLSVDLTDNNQMRFTSPLATSVDGVRNESQVDTSPPKRHRFIRNPKSAATRRMEFLSFSNNFVVRSLDDPSELQGYDIDIKPLSHRARSLSPLKQLRTYSVGRRFPSDENVLTPEHCQLIRDTWKAANEIISLGNFRSFGFLVLKRALEKLPALRTVFKLDGFLTLEEIPLDHSFVRHCGLFQSIIDLAIRNIEELETETLPAIFIYGRRHYDHELNGMFNEETVRMMCGQVVCTVIDVIGIHMSRESLEAWIEFMRCLGRALLNGYEYEQLNRNNKFSIDIKDHTFFIA